MLQGLDPGIIAHPAALPEVRSTVPSRRGSTFMGIVTLLLMGVNVLFWVPILMVVALAKLLVPVAAWRRWASALMTRIAQAWITCNGAIFGLMGVLRLEVEGVDGLRPDSWYLVLSNHRSWVDILVLQKAFNHRIPFLKFFLKQELIWVPFLGLAWWALDFPFMKRHSATYLQQHPEARGEDLEATRKACERFAQMPTSVMNFVEGTRFTAAKHRASKSPYRHLLRPRPGGVAFVLSAMGGMMQSVLDVTLAYSEPSPTLWDFCCGRVGTVRMHVQQRPIEAWSTAGDYGAESKLRAQYKDWLATLWAEKDARLDGMLAGATVAKDTAA
jgi:1-acyl-sn-glycerol-3-phosphate acyltransferase